MEYDKMDPNDEFPETCNDFQQNGDFIWNVEDIKKIKCFIFDVDGVLTDGKIQKDDTGNEIRTFDVQDGWIIHKLAYLGFITGIISGRDSQLVEYRAKELNISMVFQGFKSNKLDAYEELKKEFGLSDDEICYIGDDIIDLPLLRIVGFPATVNNARNEVKKVKNIYVSYKNGGDTAARDIIEFVLKQQGKFEQLLK